MAGNGLYRWWFEVTNWWRFSRRSVLTGEAPPAARICLLANSPSPVSILMINITRKHTGYDTCYNNEAPKGYSALRSYLISFASSCFYYIRCVLLFWAFKFWKWHIIICVWCVPNKYSDWEITPTVGTSFFKTRTRKKTSSYIWHFRHFHSNADLEATIEVFSGQDQQALFPNNHGWNL